MNFWKKLKTLRHTGSTTLTTSQGEPFTVLAPMANVTDWAFRNIVADCGRSDVFYTEFISADGISAVGHEKFKGELYFEVNERPIVAQFFGSKPENFYKCAQLAQELGFDGIDINMGCPDKSVEKQGAGASLIKNPELAREIIKQTIRGAGKLPVSVKTRLGYNKIETETWIPHLLNTDISALTVHARIRKDMSKTPARWEELGKIVEMAKGTDKLIIGNGDVKNLNEGYDKANKYGLDGMMVGRGIFENPWFFCGIADSAERTPIERIKLLKKHLDNFEKLWGSNKNFDVMKRFFKIYINGWPGAKELRIKLMNTVNIQEAMSILKM